MGDGIGLQLSRYRPQRERVRRQLGDKGLDLVRDVVARSSPEQRIVSRRASHLATYVCEALQAGVPLKVNALFSSTRSRV